MRSQTRATLAIAFCSLLLPRLSPSKAFAQTAQEVAKKAFGSTVLLVMEDANGQPLSLGSGGCSEALSIGNSDAVQVGDSVYAVGNPEGLEGTFSQGIVSGIRESGGDRLLQITAPISPGSSGGPVLNEKGEVIGVSVATFRDGQNLNFAVPSAQLKELLSKAGPLMPLAEAKAQKSVLADDEHSSGGVVGEKFTLGWLGGEYSFSIHNGLRESVKNVSCLIVFYDKTNSPIDFSQITYSGTIPGGLSKRVTGSVPDSTAQLIPRPADPALRSLLGLSSNTPNDAAPTPPVEAPPVEIRILDFQIVQ